MRYNIFKGLGLKEYATPLALLYRVPTDIGVRSAKRISIKNNNTENFLIYIFIYLFINYNLFTYLQSVGGRGLCRGSMCIDGDRIASGFGRANQAGAYRKQA